MVEGKSDAEKTAAEFVFPNGQLFSELLLFVSDVTGDDGAVISFGPDLRIYRMNPAHTVFAEAVVPSSTLASRVGVGDYLIRLPRDNLPADRHRIHFKVVAEGQMYQTLVHATDCSLALDTEVVQTIPSPAIAFEYEATLTMEEFTKIRRIRGPAELSVSADSSPEIAEGAGRGKGQRTLKLNVIRKRWISDSIQGRQREQGIKGRYDFSLLAKLALPRSGLSNITFAFGQQKPLVLVSRIPLNGVGIVCSCLVAPLDSDDS